MPQNSLTLVIDEQGIYYRVPICVINDPLNFNADFLTEKLREKKAPQQNIVKVSYNLLHQKAFKKSFPVDLCP